MLQIRRYPDLTQESLGAEYGAQLGEEELECDLPVVAEIAREVNGRHTAMSDLPLDQVAAG